MFLVSFYSNMFGRVCTCIIGEVSMIEQSRLVRNIRTTFMLLLAASSKVKLRLGNMHRQYMHSSFARHWQV